MRLLSDLTSVLPRLGGQEIRRFRNTLDKYGEHLSSISEALYEKLDAEDQGRFVVWFLKRWAKIDLIDPSEARRYKQKIQDVKGEARASVQLMGKTYKLRDFTAQGHDFKLLGYDWFLGVHDIFYNQYEHKGFRFKPNDVIVDAGAFIGDTAVFFYRRLGGLCTIHCFDLLDENIALLHHNLEINDTDASCFVVNKLALTDSSDGEIGIAGGRTQGSTSIFGGVASGDKVKTITLDDYVLRKGISRLDVIKMDLEGAEPAALRGAFRSIQRFRPRLALCLYHKWDDVVTIPKLIESTGVNYSYYFKWVQLSDGWEAVLLAVPQEKEGSVRGSEAADSRMGGDLASVRTDRNFDALN